MSNDMARRARKRLEKAQGEGTVVEAIVKESGAMSDRPDVLKKQALVKAVAAATDQPNRVARSVIEATLVELRRALEDGRDLQLPPLGRVRVGKKGGKDGAPVIAAKIRLAREPDPNETAPDGPGDGTDGDDDANSALAQAAE